MTRPLFPQKIILGVALCKGVWWRCFDSQPTMQVQAESAYHVSRFHVTLEGNGSR